MAMTAALVAPAALASPPSAEAVSLADAIAMAVHESPMLIAREASGEAAREELARAGELPDPRLSFGIQNLPIAGSDAFSLTDDRMTMRRVGLSQALPSSAKRQARRQVAQAQVAEAVALEVTAELDVRRATAQAWIELWAATLERELLQTLREDAERGFDAARAQLAGGVGSAADALAAKQLDLELQNELDLAAARIAAARASLARWTGEAIATTTPPPDFSVAPASEGELLVALDQQGPLLAWEAQEAVAEAMLARARADKSPDWSLAGGFAQRGAGASDVVWVEVGVDLPLFAARRQDRGIAARAADLAALQASRDDARRLQTEIVRRAFARWQGLGQQVARFRQELLPLGRDRSAVALAAYAGGAALQDWIDARRDEITMRLDYAQALAAWGMAWAELAFLLPEGELR